MTKRRSPGQGHIKKIKLRSGATAYRGFLTVGYKLNAKGEQVPIKRTCQARTRREVDEGLERLRIKYRVGVDLDAEKMRLRQLLDKWLAHTEVVDKPPATTLTSYRWGATRICTALDNPLVVKVNPYQLQSTLFALGAELGRSALNTIRAVLRGAFGQAVIWRIITENPARDLELPKAEKEPERRALTVEEVGRFRAALKGERLELAALITVAFGTRRGETAAIKLAQIDQKAQTLTIDAQHQRNRGTKQIERVDTKGNDVRIFRVDEWLRLAIAQHVERLASERKAMGSAWTAPDEGLLFVRETDGGRLDGEQIYDVVTRAAKRAGLGKVRPHDLRRTLQSLLAVEGVDRNVRAEIAGHSDADTTDKHYRLVYEGEAGTALSKMARILGLDQPAAEGSDDEK